MSDRVVTAVDWSRFRKCPVCFAAIGEPCMRLSWGDRMDHGYVPLSQPHSSRKPRTGGAS